ncbi:MAG: DUF2807 domain-containing protein [Candidatus Riflebacteria bacterium]|nr:DUF2807 domain-containing protein [Candidatus Riflebacteria bacterium]
MHNIRFSTWVFCAVILFSVIFAADCSTGTSGSGKIKTEHRTLGEFKYINLTGNYIVTIETGQSEHAVDVTIDDNLVTLVKTETVDGILKVSHQSDIKPTKRIGLRISMKEIATLSVVGMGQIEAKNISGNTFKLRLVGGATNIFLSGAVDNLLVAGEAGNIKAGDLKAKCVDIALGSGHAEVFASESLTAQGNVEYYGNPLKVVSSGNVTRKN